MVICLKRGADLHMAQLMPLPLTVSCFSKIQTGFTFLVLAYPSSHANKGPLNGCVCVCVCLFPCLCSSVRDHTFETTRPIITKFLFMLPKASARSSSGDVVICCVLPVFWMTPYLHIRQGCTTSLPS